MRADWYVYVLECADETLYTGITTEPERRLREHNTSSKGAAYTRARRPVEICALWPCEDQSEAASAEAAFKQLTRDQKLDRLAVGLDGETCTELADEYRRVFGLDGDSDAEARPLKLAGDEVPTVRRARRYREMVFAHLDTLGETSTDVAGAAERVTPHFAVGPGWIDGHGLVVAGEPVVFFDMRLIDRHFENDDSFEPEVHVAHEVAHAVHYDLVPSFYPGCEKSPAEEVWHRLVAEGLAQRISEVSTGCGPRVSTWFGFLDEEAWTSWRARTQSRREEVAAALELDASIRFDDPLWDELFRGSGDLETMRLGYWWGYHIVERAEERHDLVTLLAMSPEAWRPHVHEVLGGE
jgi:putative endonuclease